MHHLFHLDPADTCSRQGVSAHVFSNQRRHAAVRVVRVEEEEGARDPLERLHLIRRPQGEQGRGEQGSLSEASTEGATPASDTVDLGAGMSLTQKLEDSHRVIPWQVASHLQSQHLMVYHIV